jgi:8-oxo-dGTP pyrophosphatase MutT (NUDIX family)
VPRAALPVLQAWPQWLALTPQAVALVAPDPDAALAQMNAALREQGWVRAWRDELFAITDPATGRHLARTERAASRFWGTLTLGAHANGYLADSRGRPTHLWVAQRSFSKATDPGMRDNLVGGGVPMGQTPHETLVREGWEEAGLTPQQMAPARHGSVLRLHRDIPEGLQLEDLHAFDLALPQGLSPQNQDGEVAGFACLPVAEALALAASGAMTVDAELVTLDFALRHRLLPAAEADLLGLAIGPLRVR